MTGLYVLIVMIVIAIVLAGINEGHKAAHPPKPPVKFLGDDGLYHYLPGQDPAERDDPNRWNFDHNS